MSIVFEERFSDSPYIETVTHGYTTKDGSSVRPAEANWHMVFSKHNGQVYPLVVGPLPSSGVVAYGGGAEILWIKFKLGTFMPHLPVNHLLNKEQLLPEAAHKSFWLNNDTWQLPDYENVETFVDWLVRHEVLVSDPIVTAVLQAETPQEVASRTIRYRFARATGLTRTHILQVERAKQAATLLAQGIAIQDVVFDLGYFDQPHLTRSMKRFIGKTPAQQFLRKD